MDKTIIHDHFSTTAITWRDQVYKPQNQQGVFEYFDKQYRFDYVTEMVPSVNNGIFRALDVGCGAGQMIPILATKGYEVHAIDVSQNMVDLAKQEAERSNVDAKIQIGDCEYLDYPDNYFDVYVAMGVIEYMDDDLPMLKEIQRVLKPGSIAIVTARNILSPHVRWRTFYRKYVNVFLKNLIRPLFGRPAQTYVAISKEHFPKKFREEIKKLKFSVLEHRFAHFYCFPMPLNKFLFPLEAMIGKKLEKLLSRKNVPFFASTYILKFRK